MLAEFTKDEIGDIVDNTIYHGALGDALEEVVTDHFYATVPGHMPAGLTKGLATHLNAWAANVAQRRDPEHTEFLWELIQSFAFSGVLTLRDADGCAYYGLRRADLICPVCQEVEA